MIRILITEAALLAIGGDVASQKAQDGSGRYGAAPGGYVAIWLPTAACEALRAAKGHRSYSEAILELAAGAP